MEDSIWLKVKDILKEFGVLILVVMEDSIWLRFSLLKAVWTGLVLILVVMEDSIWRNAVFLKEKGCKSLNPCCNGR